MHEVKGKNWHGYLVILKCAKGWLKAFCKANPNNSGELLEVRFDLKNPDNYWCIGVFEHATGTCFEIS